MPEIVTVPEGETLLKLLVAASVLALIGGLAGLYSNLVWCVENRRDRKKKRNDQI